MVFFIKKKKEFLFVFLEVQREKGDKQNEVEASESKHSWMKSNASKIVKDKSVINLFLSEWNKFF